MASVFISSTGYDLSDYRSAAIEICNRLGLIPVAMEFFEAMGTGASAGSIAKLNTADVYVGIFAHRYGYIEEGQTVSITEIEFDAAGSLGLERLCFLVKPDHPWPPAAIDCVHHEKLSRFKEKVNKSVIRHEFSSVDDFKAKLHQTLSEWQKQSPEPAAIDSILDLFATRRAFFKGDDVALQQAVKMLISRDAGRAVVVARSLAEVVADLECALSQLRTRVHSTLKQALSQLVVACKDYVEIYGHQQGESSLPLPHIGMGQRIEDFTGREERFELMSRDSFEVYKAILEYMSQSFRDLIPVRLRAVEVIDRIVDVEPSLKDRCETIRGPILEGRNYLEDRLAAIDHAVRIIDEVISTTPDFTERKALAAKRSETEHDKTVSSLVKAISQVPNAQAWSRRSSGNTLKHVEHAGDLTLRITFADGFTGELELNRDYWEHYEGVSMDPIRFRTMRLNSAQNWVEWEGRIFVTGEKLQKMLLSK